MSKYPLLFLTIITIIFITIQAKTSSPIDYFTVLDEGLVSTCTGDEDKAIPIFLGDLKSLQPTPAPTPTPMNPTMTVLGGGGGHGHNPYDPNADYTDTSKWSTYPQKSQNAHIAIGVLTSFTLYIWLCNVNGWLQLSKAFMLTGIVQIAQGLYLIAWVLYLLHPQDLDALWEYSLNDVMELQHLAISTCLLVTGVWDFITGWVLHWQIPIYIDSYSRQIQRPNQTNNGRIKQPNNLLFWQRYIPIIITVGHILNGANFIKHPQHSDENTIGHVILGLSMMLGGFCFYWVRVRHKVWRHFVQEIYPNLQNETHMSLSTLTNGTTVSINQTDNIQGEDDSTHVDPIDRNDINNNDGEVWNVGARYSIEDLQTLGAMHSGTVNNRPRGRFNGLSTFDIFAFDTTPPPPPPVAAKNDDDDDDDNLDDDDAQPPVPLIHDAQYRSSSYNQYEWNGSILDVEYKKHLYPHLNKKFKWNSVSTSRFINYIDNARRYVLHHVWYTKTLRELITTFFAGVATFNFIFIAWLLMTFIEPPEEVHFTHWYSCYIETKFAYLTVFVNAVLSISALSYLLLTFFHYKGLVYFPSLYKINIFQK